MIVFGVKWIYIVFGVEETEWRICVVTECTVDVLLRTLFDLFYRCSLVLGPQVDVGGIGKIDASGHGE